MMMNIFLSLTPLLTHMRSLPAFCLRLSLIVIYFPPALTCTLLIPRSHVHTPGSQAHPCAFISPLPPSLPLPPSVLLLSPGPRPRAHSHLSGFSRMRVSTAAMSPT